MLYQSKHAKQPAKGGPRDGNGENRRPVRGPSPHSNEHNSARGRDIGRGTPTFSGKYGR